MNDEFNLEFQRNRSDGIFGVSCTIAFNSSFLLMRQVISVILAAYRASADMCSDICQENPRLCGSSGSHCDASENCADLFWSSDEKVSLCNAMSKDCPKDLPLKCSEAQLCIAGEVPMATVLDDGSDEEDLPSLVGDQSDWYESNSIWNFDHLPMFPFNSPFDSPMALSAMGEDYCAQMRAVSSYSDAGGSYCQDDGVCHDLFRNDDHTICNHTIDVNCSLKEPLTCEAARTEVSLLSLQPSFLNRGKRGIGNLRNTCYLAASMQILLHSRDLRAIMMKAHMFPVELPESASESDALNAQGLTRVGNIFNEQWGADSSKEINVEALRQFLAKSRGYGFEIGEMEDAHDATMELINIIARALRNGSPESTVDRLFNIHTQAGITCTACGASRNVPNKEFGLHMAIPEIAGRDTYTLAEIFASHFSPERVSEVACEGGRCGPADRNDANMQAFLTASPQLLLIGLKRFRADGSRINAKISITEELDLSTVAGNGTGRYRLIGIVHHKGSTLTWGHYVAEFRHPDDNLFYSANDSRVTPLTGSPNLSDTTQYVLLYEKNDPVDNSEESETRASMPS